MRLERGGEARPQESPGRIHQPHRASDRLLREPWVNAQRLNDPDDSYWRA